MQIMNDKLFETDKIISMQNLHRQNSLSKKTQEAESQRMVGCRSSILRSSTSEQDRILPFNSQIERRDQQRPLEADNNSNVPNESS